MPFARRRLRISVGVSLRALSGEIACGDACEAVPWSRGTLLALVDGLGHGPSAAAAAQAFLHSVREDREEPLETMFQRAHRNLLKTRGAVAAVARFDERDGQLCLGGLGNVSTMLARKESGKIERPVLAAGVLGSAYRSVRPQELRFANGDMLIMHTDGLRNRFDLGTLHGLSVQSMADALLRTHARNGDDAGCVVVRGLLGEQSAPPRAEAANDAPEAHELPVRERSEADCAAQAARAFAACAGLGPKAQWEVSIATSELATNIVRHGERGVIRLRLEVQPRKALVVEAIDHGQGKDKVAVALSRNAGPRKPRATGLLAEGRSLGVGIGSVLRMMDTVELDERAAGTHIVARKLFP